MNPAFAAAVVLVLLFILLRNTLSFICKLWGNSEVTVTKVPLVLIPEIIFGFLLEFIFAIDASSVVVDDSWRV